MTRHALSKWSTAGVQRTKLKETNSAGQSTFGFMHWSNTRYSLPYSTRSNTAPRVCREPSSSKPTVQGRVHLASCTGQIHETACPAAHVLTQHPGFVFVFVGCLTSQQQVSVSQGRSCTDNFTCCHTEIEVADSILTPGRPVPVLTL